MKYTQPPAPSGTTHVHIAIVGMGPRGTSTLERICASAPDFLVPGAHLTVHVVDPSPPGAGRVWRTEQSSELLMNTVTSQITLFTDKSVVCSGPIREGPSLHQWASAAKLGLSPDEYPIRALYGHYLEWVFNKVVREAPPELEVEVHTARAVRLDNAADGRQTLTLSTGRSLPGLSAVILAQGHLPLLADPEQQQLAVYAGQNGLRHFSPSNPADVDLSTIQAGESIFLRGLGLNFFDYMALLTTGRGGRFTRTSHGLRYHPSGKEPRLYAGSRRGIPYQARGDNAKGAYGRHMPLVFTEEVISTFRKRAESGDAPDFLREIWPLVSKEVEVIFYEALFKQHGKEHADFRDRFLATTHQSPEEAELLDEFGISAENRWSWDRISRPYGERTFTAGVWRDWLLQYLRDDAKEASLNNVDGPLKAALDILRDLRNELRLIVDHAGVSGASHRDHLDRWYTPLNAFLSIGPPRQRIEQMIALIEAGILDVLGPRPEVRAEDGAWIARSPEVPGLTVRVTTLIEARLPEPNLRHTADELLAHLLKSGQCRPHTVGAYETNGMDVTESPYRLIDSKGRAHERRFAVGVPTEGVHWVTAAGARPGVNSVTLSDTDAVARAALHSALTGTAVAQPVADLTSWPLVEVSKGEVSKVEVVEVAA
ncbi:FAD-NAD(P)-binding-domain-containing protein [Aspergillus coremiiformis]|uniref:FAD-NAD(P)-binding-domain-containing protein n=1 Tax=Aspergillus coremiiformis TaxID=138285 RepID=A0A5N6ZF55_9EURO|nr:FAD-NAD(P)-binding-domain-containing protein [Aspergillus coremiiformis]